MVIIFFEDFKSVVLLIWLLLDVTAQKSKILLLSDLFIHPANLIEPVPWARHCFKCLGYIVE